MCEARARTCWTRLPTLHLCPLSPMHRPPTPQTPCRRSCWRWCCWTWRRPTRPMRRREPTARSTSRCGRALAPAHAQCALCGPAHGFYSWPPPQQRGRPARALSCYAAPCCTLCIDIMKVSDSYMRACTTATLGHAIAQRGAGMPLRLGGAAVPVAMHRKTKHHNAGPTNVADRTPTMRALRSGWTGCWRTCGTSAGARASRWTCCTSTGQRPRPFQIL